LAVISLSAGPSVLYRTRVIASVCKQTAGEHYNYLIWTLLVALDQIDQCASAG
jgi:hypothetical protein